MKRRSSWKTTLGGCLTAAGAAMLALAGAKPDWMWPWELHACYALGTTFAIGGPFVTGLFARDVNVTSEEAGAVKPISKEDSQGPVVKP